MSNFRKSNIRGCFFVSYIFCDTKLTYSVVVLIFPKLGIIYIYSPAKLQKNYPQMPLP